MKKLIGIGSLTLTLVLGGGNAFGQSCRPPYAYCAAQAPHVYLNTPLPAAASSNDCPPGASQAPISECEASWLRRDRTNSGAFASAGVAQIRPGQQFTVQAIPGPRTYITQRDPRYAGVRVDVRNLQQDVRALDANDELEILQRRAADRVLMENQEELRRRNAATNTRVNNVEWQIGDLREEWNMGVASVVRWTYQPGGSPTLGLGINLSINHFAQGSDFGVEGDISLLPLESQPLVPGRTPLLGMSGGIHGIYGRRMVQFLFGGETSGVFRFGDAGPREVTGGTAFFLGAGIGGRLNIPFRPIARPRGARFFLELKLHVGLGLVNALAPGQDPLHAGPAVALNGGLGFAF